MLRGDKYFTFMCINLDLRLACPLNTMNILVTQANIKLIIYNINRSFV